MLANSVTASQRNNLVLQNLLLPICMILKEDKVFQFYKLNS